MIQSLLTPSSSVPLNQLAHNSASRRWRFPELPVHVRPIFCVKTNGCFDKGLSYCICTKCHLKELPTGITLPDSLSVKTASAERQAFIAEFLACCSKAGKNRLTFMNMIVSAGCLVFKENATNLSCRSYFCFFWAIVCGMSGGARSHEHLTYTYNADGTHRGFSNYTDAQ
jgi:hypothetical protein